MNDLDELKRAVTSVPIHEPIARRWSPRAFAARELTDDELKGLFEAARWAASSRNEQPWRFVAGDRQRTPQVHARLAGVLSGGNAEWAPRAPLLVLAIAKEAFDHNGKPNRHAGHDVGQALATMAIQATAAGLRMHMMAGFDAEAARAEFQVPAGFQPMTMAAIGAPGDPATLADKRAEQERAPRDRQPLGELVFAGDFAASAPWV